MNNLLYVVHVYLADNEWGNELMAKVAEEVYSLHKDKSPLLIHVHEHAGWVLSYTMSDKENQLITVGSANDAAVYYGEKKRLREQFYNMKQEYLPEIRRVTFLPCSGED